MNDNAKKWVAALRSGQYKQGAGRLRTGNRFCCLGVACELYRQEQDGEWTTDGFFLPDTLQDAIPLPQVQAWLGLVTRCGGFDNGNQSLTRLNDSGFTFEQIADIIESEPDGLFKRASW